MEEQNVAGHPLNMFSKSGILQYVCTHREIYTHTQKASCEHRRNKLNKLMYGMKLHLFQELVNMIYLFSNKHSYTKIALLRESCLCELVPIVSVRIH